VTLRLWQVQNNPMMFDFFISKNFWRFFMNDALRYLNNLRKFKNAVDKYLMPGLWDKTLRAEAEKITKDRLEKIKNLIDDGQTYTEQMKILDSIGLPSTSSGKYKLIRLPEELLFDLEDNFFVELKRKLKNKEEFHEKYGDEWYQYYISAYTKDGEYCTSFAIESKDYKHIEYYYLLSPKHALYAYDEER
jgi:hypothetical protein